MIPARNETHVARRAILAAVSLCCVAAANPSLRAQASGPSTGRTYNHLPVVTSTLPEHALFSSRAPVRFNVTITDPDGDPIFARVVDGPREMGFAPIRNAVSPVTREVVFYPSDANDCGRQRFVVEAWDVRRPVQETRVTFTFRIVGGVGSHGIRTANLDADPEIEIVARSIYGNVRGVGDAGAFVLFDGQLPSTGTVRSDYLVGDPPVSNGLDWHDEEFADVTGDGIDDLIVVHQHKDVAVWFGGRVGGGIRPADATLQSSDPNVGTSYHASLMIEDVTGDGILDVVVGCPWVDTAVIDAGEVLVFAGGTGLVGTPLPTATLRVSGAKAFDMLGYESGMLEPLLADDVTGDGIADVLVVAPYADFGSTADVGAIYVWRGGAALAGTPAPKATLATMGNTKSKQLGYVPTAPAVFLVDVTGDGTRDVVAGSSLTSPRGAVFVWKGGSGISGSINPTARLEPKSGTGAGLLETNGSATQGLQFADLDLDGITDIVAARSDAKVSGVLSAGAIYVFAGGALSGTVNETALLKRKSPVQADFLASARTGLQIVDVTGDGAPDVIAGSPDTDAVALDSGAIEVWAARTGLSGTLVPSASLEVTGAAPGSQLTLAAGQGTGILVADVTGDRTNDIVGASNANAIYVWAGGVSLTSGTSVAPTATLIDTVAPKSYFLGWNAGQGPSVHLVDFSGDGILDLVAYAEIRNTLLHYTTGRALVWFGGTGLNGTSAAGAVAATTQPWDHFGGSGDKLWFADVNDDGKVDLIAMAHQYVTSRGLTGAGFIFAGGAASTGNLAPSATLEDPQATAGDYLGLRTECRFVDLDADGIDDLVVGDSDAYVDSLSGGVVLSGAGKILIFHGPIASHSPTADAWIAPRLGSNSFLGW